MSLRGRKFGNETIDVLNKGCFAPFDVLACMRSSILTTAAGITIVFVVFKIIKYHMYKYKQVQHYAIFYVTAIETVVCGAAFMLGYKYPQFEMTANFLKLLQFSIICHLHWSVAARTFHKEGLTQHFINPCLCLFMIYCTVVALMGMADIATTWNQCLKQYWLMLSAADLILVQCFAIAALYITHKTDGLTVLASFKSSQKRDLITVVTAYEISAIFSVAFDAIMRLVGTEETGCSGVFGHSQFFYSATELLFDTAKYFIPIWAIIAVFQPVEDSTCNSEMAISASYNLDGTPTSVRSAIRGNHLYHRMFVPSNNPTAILSPDSLLTLHPTFHQDATPSPTLSDTSLPSLTSHHLEYPKISMSDAMSYTNKVNLNYNEDINIITRNSDCVPFVSCSNKLSVTNYNRPNLTTISEESNINIPPSGESTEHNSIKSEVESSYY